MEDLINIISFGFKLNKCEIIISGLNIYVYKCGFNICIIQIRDDYLSILNDNGVLKINYCDLDVDKMIYDCLVYF